MNDELNTAAAISWNDIKLFFRGVDIAVMRKRSGAISGTNTVSLDSYEETVRRKQVISQLISSRESRVMPKPPFSRWNQAKVDLFNQWAQADEPLVIDPIRGAQARTFLAVSQFLTGFDALHEDPELAVKHLIRLHHRAGVGGDPPDDNAYTEGDLTGLIAAFDPFDTQHFEETILTQDKFARIAQVIILLWYTGAFLQGGFAVDSGTPENNQFIQGLVWRVIHAHPPGYASEGRDASNGFDNFHYWRKAPRDGGQYTGLGAKQPSPSQLG